MRLALSTHDQDFTSTSLPRAVALLAIPMVLEPLMESLFMLVDAFFVARLGAKAVAAVGLTEALVTLVYTVGFGLAFPVTALVARHVGENRPERAASVAVQTNLLALGSGLLLALPGSFLGGVGLELMGAEPAVVAQGSLYAAVCLGSSPIIMGLILNAAVFRGSGDATVALRALWLANGLNIVLDPCLIFGLGPFPELGLLGAAIATAAGRSAGLLCLMVMLFRGTPRLKVRARHLRWDGRVLLELLQKSVGGIGQLFVETTSWVFLTRVLAVCGSAAVAGYTIAFRVLMFASMPAWGLSNAAATLVGQNLGAQRPDRATRSVQLTGIYNMLFLGAVTVVCATLNEPIALLFTNDAAVVPIAAEGMRIVGYGYVFYAWGMVLVQAFNGAGDTSTPLYINLVSFWVVKLPLAYLLAIVLKMEANGVYLAVLIAYSLNAGLAYLLFRRGNWKRGKPQQPKEARDACSTAKRN